MTTEINTGSQLNTAKAYVSQLLTVVYGLVTLNWPYLKFNVFTYVFFYTK